MPFDNWTCLSVLERERYNFHYGTCVSDYVLMHFLSLYVRYSATAIRTRKRAAPDRIARATIAVPPGAFPPENPELTPWRSFPPKASPAVPSGREHVEHAPQADCPHNRAGSLWRTSRSSSATIEL